jgi:hypothetical protein
MSINDVFMAKLHVGLNIAIIPARGEMFAQPRNNRTQPKIRLHFFVRIICILGRFPILWDLYDGSG